MARCLHQWEGPTKLLFSEWGGLEPKGTWCRLQISWNSYNGLLLPPRSGWMATIYFIRWLKVTRIRGWFLTKGRWLSLLAGCIYHPPCRCLRCNPQTEQEWFHAVATGCAAPSTTLLLKAQSSDWARIIPVLYTQAAPSSMLLFKVQSSDWARIIPLHKVAYDTTKKELPGLYSSHNITKGGRSSWLVC